MKVEQLKTDCRHFRGDIPCHPHKQSGVHCIEHDGIVCKNYNPTDSKILIIKLGAVGDVIRTTPLLYKIKEVYPRALIYWLTLTPEILPSLIDVPMDFSLQNIVSLQSIPFDIIYNLDKDREACALMKQLSAKVKKGFILKNGKAAPIDAAAEHKYMTGLFDDISQQNTKSYQEEIFEICGFTFSGERYILDKPKQGEHKWKFNKKKKVIGLNTGCGSRWTSRLWSDKNWVMLAKTLKRKGYEVVLLGGTEEDKKNKKLAKLSGAKYFGYFPLDEFFALIDQCDLVVTGVTMGMHITIGLGKKIVLMNNIFNRNEFELYGLGEIVEPKKPCRCYFQPICTNPEYRCMEHLNVSQIVDACRRQLM